MIKKIKLGIKIIIIKIINFMFMIFPIDQKKVLFLSDQRAALGANLACMYDYIKDDEYKKITLLKKDNFQHRSLKENIVLIYHLTTAKYILLDDWAKFVSIIRRRKKQVIVQLWHGPGAFKTFGYSRHDYTKKKSKYRMHRNYTKAIVTAEDIRWCFAEGFGMDVANVKATGFPRTDCFFDKKYCENVRRDFYKSYPELKKKKIVLFAPTYRGETLNEAYYKFDELNLKMLKDELGDDYAFIIKWHPAINSLLENGKLSFDASGYDGFIYDFSKERDINDLLLITDVLVTDYSSVIFDYYLVDKPIVYFTYDLEEYKSGRGLYFPFLDYVYGATATNCEEMIKAIKKGDMCEAKRKKFYQKFMSACDGKATEKTYNFIFDKDQK